MHPETREKRRIFLEQKFGLDKLQLGVPKCKTIYYKDLKSIRNYFAEYGRLIEKRISVRVARGPQERIRDTTRITICVEKQNIPMTPPVSKRITITNVDLDEIYSFNLSHAQAGSTYKISCRPYETTNDVFKLIKQRFARYPKTFFAMRILPNYGILIKCLGRYATNSSRAQYPFRMMDVGDIVHFKPKDMDLAKRAMSRATETIGFKFEFWEWNEILSVHRTA